MISPQKRQFRIWNESFEISQNLSQIFNISYVVYDITHIIWVWSYWNFDIIKSKCCESSLDNKSFSSINDWKWSWSHLFNRLISRLFRRPKTCWILRFQSCCCSFCWRKFWTITLWFFWDEPRTIKNRFKIIFTLLGIMEDHAGRNGRITRENNGLFSELKVLILQLAYKAVHCSWFFKKWLFWSYDFKVQKASFRN